jgi:aspartate/methionine/tyrosine aminotransferase
MKIKRFATEHFYEQYEFTTPYQLCNSDCETLTVSGLLEMAGRSLEDLGALTLGYTESQGNPALRKAIAAQYETVSDDDVMVLGTPVEGIFLVASALLEPSDEVIVLTPAYDALINMFEHIVGADRVRQWPFSASADGWQLDFGMLEDLIGDKTRLLVINFPHNPTGYSPNRPGLETIMEIAEKHDLLIFSDEMYRGLNHSGMPAIPSMADIGTRAVVLSGLSKTHGLPGLRTGWLIAKDRALNAELKNWKFYTSICPPAPSEFLAETALSISEKLRRRSVEQIEANLELAAAFFKRWPDLFDWYAPRSGSTALVKMHVPSLMRLSAQLAQEAGVLIHPATTLGSDDQHMRIGLGRKGFAAALEKFEMYLQENKHRL